MSGEMSQPRYLVANQFWLDCLDERLWVKGTASKLVGKPVALLKALMERPHVLVTKDELFERVWPDVTVSEAVLTTAVKEARQALGDKARKPTIIETVHGRGYRLKVDVDARDILGRGRAFQGWRDQLKDVPIWRATAILVAILAIAGALTFIGPFSKPAEIAQAQAPYPKSIAVLPFKDLSSMRDQQWFAAGITEEILNSLARAPDLHVAARTSAEVADDQDVRTIGRKLNVAYVLEGSVRRDGGRTRVTAQLIRSSDGMHLWSQNFDRGAADVIDIQEQIAVAIARSLQSVMSPAKLQAMVNLGTRSVDAYQEYLRGLAYQERELETGDAADTQNAFDAFERARRLDPQFAAAHWAAASQYFSRATRVGSAARQSGDDERGRMKEYLLRVDAAIASSDGRPENLKYRSARALVDYRFKDAVTLMRQYLDQRPRELDAWDDLVNLSAYIGDRRLGAEAARTIQQQSVESGRPLSRAITASVLALDIPNAVQRSRQQLKMRPGEALIQYQAHRALLWGGYRDEARALIGPIRESSLPEENKLLAELRQACADGDSGARDIALKLDGLKGASTSGRWQAWMLAGDEERAYALIKPLDQPDRLSTLVQYMTYPDFDARRFPLLQSKLDEDGIVRPTLVRPPYACAPGKA
jgi:TolB-like protein/DNA-binding winged helix-turn-helix (wHTH) protein